jgi:hypothetical protein
MSARSPMSATVSVCTDDPLGAVRPVEATRNGEKQKSPALPCGEVE